MADTVPADLTTTATATVNGNRYGTIETAGDVDWYKVTLSAGNYHINLVGDPYYGSGLADTLLRVYNSAGVQLRLDDDNGAASNSYLDFTASTSGTYYIAAAAWSSYTGDYQVSVLTNDVDTYYLNVGTSVTNRADAGGEEDRYLVELEAGVTYTFTMASESGGINSRSDPLTPLIHKTLWMEAPSGTLVDLYDDQTGTITFTYTAATTGTYRLHAYGHGDTGHYSLSATTPNPQLEHKPAGGDVAVSIAEDNSFAGFTTSIFPYSDADGDALGGIMITSLPTGGTLLFDGVAVSVGSRTGRFALDKLKYVPSANSSGSFSFKFAVYPVGSRQEEDPTPNTFTINVTPVNDAPVITSGGGLGAAAVHVSENQTAVTTVTASDPDSAVSFAVTGADSGLFDINASTGAVTAKTAIDFEAPTDAGGDNVYNITVIATDGALTDFQDFAIVVDNVAGNTIEGSKRDDTVDASHAFDSKAATSEEDYIDGRKGNDKLSGLGGNDTLIGGAGRDTLAGGNANDRLDGGKDADRFVFAAKLAVAGVDTIVKFEHDEDKIALENKVFKAVGSSLSSDEFYAKAGATAGKDKGDHVVYNKTTGDLYYDKDGKGGAAPVLIATLANHPGNLDHGDFLIV